MVRQTPSRDPRDYETQRNMAIDRYQRSFSKSTQLVPVLEVHKSAIFRVEKLYHLERMANNHGQGMVYYIASPVATWRYPEPPRMTIRAFVILDNGRMLSHLKDIQLEWEIKEPEE